MVTASGTKTFFHTDKLGSVVAMSDTSGNLAEGPYTYDAYGTASASTGVPFKFTGQRLDPETNCYYYRARMYCPWVGFLQTDPVGTKDDVNGYLVVHDDPTNLTDPSGKWTCASGAKTQCDVIEKSLTQAKNLLSKMTPHQARAIQKVLNFYGKRGDANHVSVASGKVDHGVAQTSTKNGETTITVNSALESTQAVEKSTGTSSAGVFVHEGQHGIDETTILGGRDPATPQEKFDTERRAFTTQSAVEQAAHYPDTGEYPLNDTNPAANGWSNATNRAWEGSGLKYGDDVNP